MTSDLEGKHCGYGRVGVENGAAEAGFRSAVSVCSRSVCLFFLLRNVDDASVSRCPASFFSVFFFFFFSCCVCRLPGWLLAQWSNSSAINTWIVSEALLAARCLDSLTVPGTLAHPRCVRAADVQTWWIWFSQLCGTLPPQFFSRVAGFLWPWGVCVFGLSSYGRLLGRHCQSEGGPGHVSGMYLLIEAVSVSRHQIEKWVSDVDSRAASPLVGCSWLWLSSEQRWRALVVSMCLLVAQRWRKWV